MGDNKLSKLTMKHQFKFLGQKWKFLKRDLENEMTRRTNVGYGKEKVLEEVAKLEKATVAERILAKTEQEVVNLLGLPSIDGNDDEFDDMDGEESMDIVRNSRTSLPPISHNQAQVDSSRNNSVVMANQGSASLYHPSQSITTLGANSSILSSKSYLTEYDADALRESIRNIKIYYSNKQMARVSDTLPINSIQAVSTSIQVNPANQLMKAVSPRIPSPGKTVPHAPPTAHPPSSKPPAVAPSRRKHYSNIDPESVAPIPIVIVPTSDDPLFSYEIPGMCI